MLFERPDDETLYAALVARDGQYEGRAYVGVTSTGIFCRLTCPARKPKPENCRFFETVGHCMEAGFRACKRCHPLRPLGEGDPTVTRLVAALQANPEQRWQEADIIALGIDPSTARRSFRRQFGITFLEMARLTRLRAGFEELRDGGRVIDAQVAAGFASPQAFRDAFARLLGTVPGKIPETALLRADWIDTPLGAMICVADARSLHLLEFADRKALPRELLRLQHAAKSPLGIGRCAITDQAEAELDRYFTGRSAAFTTPLTLHGTPFSRQVWTALRAIPAGQTRSYSDIAHTINAPTATRAVARANGANQIALMIPCHRVIGADGSLTGYGGGLWRKQQLIEIERAYTPA